MSHRVYGALAVLLACAAAQAEETKRNPDAATQSVSARGAVSLRPSACGCCQVAETANFRVRWCAGARDVEALAERCEKLSEDARLRWLGASEQWPVPCEIIVHSGVSSYVASLGRGSEQTSGCATIQIDHGRVVSRRIDLRADSADWQSESLPHELMHVVLAERFAEQRIPPWADEGIAMQAESPGKRQRRLDELRQVSKTGAVYRAPELVALNRPPAERLRAAFYGQSMVLVGLLLEKGTPQQLLEFVAATQRGDIEVALRTAYGFETWKQLEIALIERAVSNPVQPAAMPDNAAPPLRREIVSSRE